MTMINNRVPLLYKQGMSEETTRNLQSIGQLLLSAGKGATIGAGTMGAGIGGMLILKGLLDKFRGEDKPPARFIPKRLAVESDSEKKAILAERKTKRKSEKAQKEAEKRKKQFEKEMKRRQAEMKKKMSQ